MPQLYGHQLYNLPLLKLVHSEYRCNRGEESRALHIRSARRLRFLGRPVLRPFQETGLPQNDKIMWHYFCLIPSSRGERWAMYLVDRHQEGGAEGWSKEFFIARPYCLKPYSDASQFCAILTLRTLRLWVESTRKVKPSTATRSPGAGILPRYDDSKPPTVSNPSP